VFLAGLLAGWLQGKFGEFMIGCIGAILTGPFATGDFAFWNGASRTVCLQAGSFSPSLARKRRYAGETAQNNVPTVWLLAGDFTLDYNQEANFYHVFSSNHPERAASAFAPIVDYMPSARAQVRGPVHSTTHSVSLLTNTAVWSSEH
jgi:hypothetical protein